MFVGFIFDILEVCVIFKGFIFDNFFCVLVVKLLILL